MCWHLNYKCQNVRNNLQERDPSMTLLFDWMQHEYTENIQEKLNYRVAGGSGQFVDIYLVQLENLLQLISQCWQENLEG